MGMTKLDAHNNIRPAGSAERNTGYPSPQPEPDNPADAQTFGLKPEQRFSTPIWLRKITNAATLNPQLLKDLAELEASNSSITRSNVGGWHSDTNLHRLEAFKPLRQIIENVSVGCANYLGLDFQKADLVFQGMWANRNGPGDYNTSHIHPNSFLSGSYYVKVPPESGNIEFNDPVGERCMFTYPVRPEVNYLPRRLAYRCSEGLLVMFPSWLPHGVQVNRSQESRMSIAFNIDCVPKPPGGIRHAPGAGKLQSG